jgi:hypothetical protein
MQQTKTAIRLERLHSKGFDASYIIRGGMIRIKCNACKSTAINGIPCHETGCPNARHECNGCNDLIPVNQRYCSDCS